MEGERPKSGGFSARYLVSVLGCVGFAIIYGLKVNLSVAIVAMVNKTALNPDKNASIAVEGDCEPPPSSGDDEKPPDGPFEWTPSMQGLVLGSYFWGYMVSQVPGGRTAELFSAKWVFFVAVLLNVIGTVLTPPACFISYIFLLVLRVIEGIGGGFTFPAMHVLLSKWAPPNERFVMSSIVYSGTNLGTALSMLTAGALASLLGWEWVFYVMGGLSALWLILWAIFVQDSPQQQWLISAKEKEFIMTSLGQTAEKQKAPPLPMLKILLSVPFWAILVAHFCCNFGLYLLLTNLPTYMSNVLKFQIKKNAGLSAMPFLCHWVFSLIYGKILDVLQTRNLMSITNARKMSTGIASLIPAVALIGVVLVKCDRTLAVVFMSISITAIGAMYTGYLSNHIDIASNFAGTLMGITNTVASIPGFFMPWFVGYMTAEKGTTAEWAIVFYVVSGLYAFAFVFYTIFASSEEQSWNRPE